MILVGLWPCPSSPRGERYIGMWQADQRHGPGVMVTQAGVCYQGTFQADKMVVSRESLCVLDDSLEPSMSSAEADRGGWGRKLESQVPEGAWAGILYSDPPSTVLVRTQLLPASVSHQVLRLLASCKGARHL